MVCGEPVVRPVVWVAFSLQNGLVDPITRKNRVVFVIAVASLINLSLQAKNSWELSQMLSIK